ncbi:MAG: hypothetical protein HRU69_09865 [Flammeovirgaceae bacterium]|nr:MAG: hypothetical protein HRU69_09865 [Flammeovirgaceae bacterium]
MRIVGEIPHPDCKITLYSWNNRYLIKVEKGLFEQTYKINQFDIAGEDTLHAVVNEAFIRQTLALFQSMEAIWNQALLHR